MHIQLLGVRAKPDDALWFQRIYASVVSHNMMGRCDGDESEFPETPSVRVSHIH